MTKNFIIAANWKMQLTFTESLLWVKQHALELELAIKSFNYTLILCPSYIAISPISNFLKDSCSTIKLGAQDCSAHSRGAYTGQVDAESLKQAGVDYCIIGHSERRRYQKETDQEIYKKLEQCLNSSIIPILCIGETAQEKEQMLTEGVLVQQLSCIKSLLGNYYIAYEPVWAIGSGNLPDINYLDKIFSSLKAQIPASVKLLYGGSVNRNNILLLLKLTQIDGFLIGSASTDILELKSIIASLGKN
jgi:triosephosphate isomerase (TIM)